MLKEYEEEYKRISKTLDCTKEHHEGHHEKVETVDHHSDLIKNRTSKIVYKITRQKLNREAARRSTMTFNELSIFHMSGLCGKVALSHKKKTSRLKSNHSKLLIAKCVMVR